MHPSIENFTSIRDNTMDLRNGVGQKYSPSSSVHHGSGCSRKIIFYCKLEFIAVDKNSTIVVTDISSVYNRK